MEIQVGYEMVYRCPQATPMIVTLSIHYSRVSDIIKADHLVLAPPVRVNAYRDFYGNWCSRIVAPAGQIRLNGDAVVLDSFGPSTLESFKVWAVEINASESPPSGASKSNSTS